MTTTRRSPTKTVVATGAALLVLWAASFGLSYVPLGRAAIAVALVIAVAKAALVAGVFMELARERTSIRLSFAAACGLAIVLVGLMVADVVTR
jgi:cytochrome c oxidase subunit 4